MRGAVMWSRIESELSSERYVIYMNDIHFDTCTYVVDLFVMRLHNNTTLSLQCTEEYLTKTALPYPILLPTSDSGTDSVHFLGADFSVPNHH